ncbi:hypothetical protein NBRC116594_20080 [Shimia sp. NS0008-38b]|uniref:hypothetical protein n=1 Tax=Shimia sp. NS0008-38b TaxID=3127653 RepID=UPI003107EBC3
MNNDLIELNVITQARYQKAQAAMQALQAEENKLRGMLDDLTAQEKSGREVMQTDKTLQMTGGDLTWNNWIGRNRKILNHQLANILVRKEMAFKDLQSHFGKADVMETLLDHAENQRRQKRQRSLVNSVIDTKLSCL